jgi:hypothetical protein
LRSFDCISGGISGELVEAQRSPVGKLEQARPLGHGSGERSTLVPEELAFEEPVRHRAAVHVQEGPGAAPTLLVYPARQHPLAAARLPQDDNLRIACGGLLREPEDSPDHRALADELEGPCWCQHATERGVLPPQAAMLHRPPEGLLDERGLHGLPEVVERA